ncbi:Ethanolamine ammonia-lyase light chain [Granulibacter bethesdensis]|uniref:Ethanolamine ammonia-lyase small subunit n=1 Tax=Granulibacter bethesdensis TaxID=364410 RepID=A0AAC9KF50_9PROT|nr:ethanolamine ammonia-lyase subunit EutC [Granulibacter bethesdensis]APH55208.1 Ethanolamine ammonia-lyase light chain [Granulibacter bethesdensis]APH62795.1 Ethanolamine ammonia-lyase light chain [Granulibacter bethesdensis]
MVEKSAGNPPDHTASPIIDPWARLRAATSARIGLGRAGDAMRTQDVLDFQLAHARARDAVHTPLDTTALQAALAPRETILVQADVDSRSTYLRRPDLGRRLSPHCTDMLQKGDWDVVFVIADGLSSTAVQVHAAPFLHQVIGLLPGWRIAPIVIATQARVALGDDIGERLGAKLCALLVGERPGLTAADSLGVYLTYDPKRGRRDSERNCISNIHGGGLSYTTAADKLTWLMSEARSRKLTGVALKDDPLLPGAAVPTSLCADPPG